MGRPSKLNLMARGLVDRLRDSILETEFEEISTLILVKQLIDLIIAKDTSQITSELIKILENRDLAELPPEVRLDLMTKLVIRSKLPAEDKLSLSELQAGDKKVKAGKKDVQ